MMRAGLRDMPWGQWLGPAPHGQGEAPAVDALAPRIGLPRWCRSLRAWRPSVPAGRTGMRPSRLSRRSREGCQMSLTPICGTRPLVDSLRVAHGPAAVRMRRGVYEHDASTCGREWGVVGLQARGRPGPHPPSQPRPRARALCPLGHLRRRCQSIRGARARPSSERGGCTRSRPGCTVGALRGRRVPQAPCSSLVRPVPLVGLPLPPSSHATGRGACVRCGLECSFSPRAFQWAARRVEVVPECGASLIDYFADINDTLRPANVQFLAQPPRRPALRMPMRQ